MKIIRNEILGPWLDSVPYLFCKDLSLSRLVGSFTDLRPLLFSNSIKFRLIKLFYTKIKRVGFLFTNVIILVLT